MTPGMPPAHARHMLLHSSCTSRCLHRRRLCPAVGKGCSQLGQSQAVGAGLLRLHQVMMAAAAVGVVVQ